MNKMINKDNLKVKEILEYCIFMFKDLNKLTDKQREGYIKVNKKLMMREIEFIINSS